jgi:hypothetical protein
VGSQSPKATRLEETIQGGVEADAAVPQRKVDENHSHWLSPWWGERGFHAHSDPGNSWQIGKQNFTPGCR